MDIKKIKALAEIIKNYGITSLTVTEGDITISMSADHQAYCNNKQISEEIRKETTQKSEEQSPAPTAMSSDASGGIFEIKSPLVGIFYAAPSPEATPFVGIGSKVKKGETLCIIEAMKLMNEINADKDCEIVEICAKNGDIIEFGQTLFKVK
jgi:acetyl-CoA carboxylase biotin carboxyl carrier protein